MGLLQNGTWVDKWYETKSSKGEFVRQDSRFRHSIVAQSEAAAQTEFVAEADRYHLYVSLACPWAHRTLIFRQLKDLESLISVTVVDPIMLENGWEFSEGGDDLYGLSYLYEVYLKSDPNYEGRVTVPVLWDKKTQQIVNNESSEIIRIFNSAFNELTGNTQDFYPESLVTEIEAINTDVYDNVNNGVYRAGFATRQDAYERAYDRLFSALDRLEDRLSTQRYLAGSQLTEADWRLFTTLVRFDAVYVGHFKCNRNTIQQMPNLYNYLKELYQVEGVKETVSMEHIKTHYYGSHGTINPTAIVPKGPDQDLLSAHDRSRFA